MLPAQLSRQFADTLKAVRPKITRVRGW